VGCFARPSNHQGGPYLLLPGNSMFQSYAFGAFWCALKAAIAINRNLSPCFSNGADNIFFGWQPAGEVRIVMVKDNAALQLDRLVVCHGCAVAGIFHAIPERCRNINNGDTRPHHLSYNIGTLMRVDNSAGTLLQAPLPIMF